MASKWDPEKLKQEAALLQALERAPWGKRIGGYFKRTGPAWLQSAMTLGAGSAVASVVAGASFGYTLLWVQPVAMLLGVIMMAALGNIVLTTGNAPTAPLPASFIPRWPFSGHWAPSWRRSSGTSRNTAWPGPPLGPGRTGRARRTESRAAQYAVKFAGRLWILGMSIAVTWNYGRAHAASSCTRASCAG